MTRTVGTRIGADLSGLVNLPSVILTHSAFLSLSLTVDSAPRDWSALRFLSVAKNDRLCALHSRSEDQKNLFEFVHFLEIFGRVTGCAHFLTELFERNTELAAADFNVFE